MEFVAEPKFVQAVLEAEGEEPTHVVIVGWQKKQGTEKHGAIVVGTLDIQPVLWWPARTEQPVTLKRLRQVTGVDWKLGGVIVRGDFA